VRSVTRVGVSSSRQEPQPLGCIVLLNRKVTGLPVTSARISSSSSRRRFAM